MGFEPTVFRVTGGCFIRAKLRPLETIAPHFHWLVLLLQKETIALAQLPFSPTSLRPVGGFEIIAEGGN